MTPLQQKFLDAIQYNSPDADEDYISRQARLAKASEQICIEEKIELLNKILDVSANDSDALYNCAIYKTELQNQLNNLK